jgi:hypothetical protein
MQTAMNSNQTSGQVDPKCKNDSAKTDNSVMVEYKIDTTMYQVKRVYQNTQSIESLENKIMRLILGDNNRKKLVI